MTRITFRLDADLAARFEAVAASVGGRSKALRSMIERVSGPGRTPNPAPVIRSRGANRIAVRLSDDELMQLDNAATDRGVKRTDWIASTLR